MTQNDAHNDEPMTERESLQVLAEAFMASDPENLDVATNIGYIAAALERISDALEKIAAKL